ncbi:unnamed protein product [Acanthoscelides obtectus]|uniref:Uncharacterized protein n=1 Tax=Acanthoscelides obtectus TaxID=200917 RepID=A0A9P0Q7Z9_ACAOB|nr:unnamed protein product [Acanthoscelides obtectus]CAH2013590.1 unnamed protein product [Acanthoscelides obtectus]CAK1633313.1 hypothetical protein AOBTE_LOCUS8034 [Acanthoscelides obtectus]CAK1654913.1 hypothetical protein AOBTE_LOCUS18918 [Acanthoscelides obtectus]
MINGCYFAHVMIKVYDKRIANSSVFFLELAIFVLSSGACNNAQPNGWALLNSLSGRY